MSIYHENSLTPTSLAARFAKYMTDPSTVRARVKDHFGRAPSVQQCANLIQAVRKTEKREYYFRDTRLYENFKCDHERDDTNLLLTKGGEYVCLTCHKAKKARLEKLAKAQADQERYRQQVEQELARRAEEEALARQEADRLGITQAFKNHPPIATQIIFRTADAFKVSVRDLMSKDRCPLLVRARMVICVALRERGHSYPRIAQYINRIDHTSVIYLVKNYQHRVKYYPEMARALELVRAL